MADRLEPYNVGDVSDDLRAWSALVAELINELFLFAMPFARGSLRIEDGHGAVHVEELILVDDEELYLLGNSVLLIL
jgi:hypothetical protein